jgi:hypothetical protein
MDSIIFALSPSYLYWKNNRRVSFYSDQQCQQCDTICKHQWRKTSYAIGTGVVRSNIIYYCVDAPVVRIDEHGCGLYVYWFVVVVVVVVVEKYNENFSVKSSIKYNLI